MSAEEDRQALLAAVEKGIEAQPANSAKWRPLKGWFLERYGEELIPEPRTAEGKNVTAENQVWNRLHNELAGLDPRYAVITAVEAKLLPHIKKHLDSSHYPQARAFLLLDGLVPDELQVFREDEVTKSLEEMFPELTAVHIERPEHQASTSGPTLISTAVVPLAIDERIMRMVVLAIRSSQAVILVGPPGTGKTTLLREVIEKIGEDPAAFGFSGVGEPLLATPEESWTTMDLIGGQTLSEKGELRFRPGLVLDAIAQDRWLILDEANRADLDRIFGGLLTWLSADVDVDLGPVSTHVAADRVVLGWAEGGTSSVENMEGLDASKPTGQPVQYLAGDQWRLLGTYNAVDAQRVFRWGQALGRRFARVPIPAPAPDAFAESIKALTEDLPDAVHNGMVGLYTAHHSLSTGRVGPALFMHVPHYVEQGLIGNESSDALLSDLLAEGYLLTLGTTLSKLRPEDLDALGDQIVNTEGVFSAQQWNWIVDKLEALG